MAQYDYDLVTIGAGSGGVRATRLAGGYGAKAAIIEEKAPGGTCVLRGCVPKKMLVYGAHFAEDMEDAEGYGWHIGERHLDWGRLVEAKNKELKRLEGIYARILRDNHVDYVQGRGTVVDPHMVEVEGRRVTAARILVAVGGWPSLPEVPGIEHVITSNEALELTSLPKSIVIVGGGYIAVEFAGIFKAAGVDVTIIIRGDNILRGFDTDVRMTLAEEMGKRGVRILRERKILSIEKQGDGFSICLDQGEMIDAGLVMYATGRAPNTARLGLTESGVKLDRNGAVVVDEWNRSNVESIFAIGDVTDRINLTPVAINEGRCFAETFYHDRPMVMDYENVPSAVFSMPPIGSVGITEAEARARGRVKIFTSRFKPLKHTISGRDERTLCKLVVDRETDRVLGVHMVGLDAPEVVQGFAVALKCGATKAQFDATVGIHPTAAEEFVTMREPLPEPDNEHTE